MSDAPPHTTVPLALLPRRSSLIDPARIATAESPLDAFILGPTPRAPTPYPLLTPPESPPETPPVIGEDCEEPFTPPADSPSASRAGSRRASVDSHASAKSSASAAVLRPGSAQSTEEHAVGQHQAHVAEVQHSDAEDPSTPATQSAEEHTAEQHADLDADSRTSTPGLTDTHSSAASRGSSALPSAAASYSDHPATAHATSWADAYFVGARVPDPETSDSEPEPEPEDGAGAPGQAGGSQGVQQGGLAGQGHLGLQAAWRTAHVRVHVARGTAPDAVVLRLQLVLWQLMLLRVHCAFFELFLPSPAASRSASPAPPSTSPSAVSAAPTAEQSQGGQEAGEAMEDKEAEEKAEGEGKGEQRRRTVSCPAALASQAQADVAAWRARAFQAGVSAAWDAEYAAHSPQPQPRLRFVETGVRSRSPPTDAEEEDEEEVAAPKPATKGKKIHKKLWRGVRKGLSAIGRSFHARQAGSA